jgi:hypothetical protein
MRTALRHSATPRVARLLRHFVAPTLVVGAALTVGCGGDGTPAPAVTPKSVAVPLSQENNYTFKSTLKIPAVKTAPEEDLSITWDKATKDIEGHTFDPTKDIDSVAFIPVNSSSQDTVSGWLNAGTFGMGMVAFSGNAFQFVTKGATKASLTDFLSVGDSVPPVLSQVYVVDPTVTYLMVFQTGIQLGIGARTMMFLVPTDGNKVTDVSPNDDSSTLLQDFKADLTTQVPLPIAADEVLDWSNVPKDGQGNDIAAGSIDSMLLGFYADRTAKDLQTGFLNLDQPTAADGGPDMSWEVPVPSGDTARLTDGKGRNGEPDFTSFDTGSKTGTWLMAAFCSSCQNPAPLIVTVLEPK